MMRNVSEFLLRARSALELSHGQDPSAKSTASAYGHYGRFGRIACVTPALILARPDHLAPLLDLVGVQPAEIGG